MLFELSKENFNTYVLDSKTKVLIDFYAPWCKGCESLEVILEDISDDFYGDLKVYKFNVDLDDSIPDQFDIFSLPTIILFENGILKDSITGLQGYKTIKEWLITCMTSSS